MDQDRAYAIIAVGVLTGGGIVAKSALDEFFDPDKRASRAAEKKALALPLSTTDKVVQFVVVSFTVGGLMMRAYDWWKTGKAPTPEQVL